MPHPADGASARHLQAGRAVHRNNRCFGVFCLILICFFLFIYSPDSPGNFKTDMLDISDDSVI